MRQAPGEQIIINGDAALQAAFTAAATGIITSNAHGFTGGELLHVSTDDTLPSGLSAATDYYVIEVTTNTFKLSTVLDGPAVAIADAGTGTHTFNLKGKKILCTDFRHLELSAMSANSANFTYKVQSSQQEDVDFNAAASKDNRWDYIRVVNKNTGDKTNGDTGLSFSGTDSADVYEIDDNASVWITVVITTWTAGNLDIRLNAFNNN